MFLHHVGPGTHGIRCVGSSRGGGCSSSIIDWRRLLLIRQKRLLPSLSTSLLFTSAPPTSCRGWGTFLASRKEGFSIFRSTRCYSGAVSSVDQSLIERIREAYEDQETDGILSLVKSDPSVLLDNPTDELLQASLMATRDRGVAASVFNAWLGACSLLRQNDDSLVAEKASQTAQNLWKSLEETDPSSTFTKDIVTYCLAYQATQPSDFSTEILKQAKRWSKMQAGSKRRKALGAAQRRQKPDTSSMSINELEAALQQVLENDDIQILLDTNDYIVLNKPAGTCCHHTRTTTAGKISNKSKTKNSQDDDFVSTKDISLEDALLYCNIPLSTVNSECQGLVHRLDRGTSGCMIWSKTDEMHACLLTAFFLRQSLKEYTALVAPAPTETLSTAEPTIDIDSPVQGRPARSQVTLLEQFEFGKDSENVIAECTSVSSAALLLVKPSTGRRHQVRVHCAEVLKAPVLLDPLYTFNSNSRQQPSFSFLPPQLASQWKQATSSSSSSKAKDKKNKTNPKQKRQPSPTSTLPQPPQPHRIFLHASSLSIPKLNLHVQAPLPSWWNETIENLKKEDASSE